MIRHFVFSTAKAGNDVEHIRDGLSILTGIPQVIRLEIAINRKSDLISSEVDIVAYRESQDDAALAAYKAHDLYAEATRVMRPPRELRRAADYDVSEATIGPIGSQTRGSGASLPR